MQRTRSSPQAASHSELSRAPVVCPFLAESWLLQGPEVVQSLQLGLCHPVPSGFRGPTDRGMGETEKGHSLNKGH